MKKINGSRELKINIEGRARPVSEVQEKLDELHVRQTRLAEAINEANKIENPTPEQAREKERLQLDQRLNDARIKSLSDPLDAAQFRQRVTITN